MKRAIILATVIVALSGAATWAADPKPKLSAPGSFPVVDRKVTITVAVPAPTDSTTILEENAFTRAYEAKTNIHIDWQLIPGANFKEKINLMLASGDLPDVIDTGVGAANRLDKMDEAQIGAQGLIIPLNKLIETQSVWFKKALAEQEGLREYITAPDGNIYALPNIADEYHTTYPQKLWINTAWLKKLGLEMPRTTEDLYKVLKAFKERDPNGNGKADEIPLSTCKAGSNVELDGFLMNPFTYSPGGDRLWIDGGKVTFSAATPGYKEGLKYIARLYREGLINRESFTQDQKTQVSVNESGDAPTIGAFPSLHLGYGANLTASPRWQQYDSVPPLVGPSGKAIATIQPYANKYITGMYSITSACKNPEVAFRLVDWMYSEEGTIAAMVGEEGKAWVKAKAGEKGLTGKQAKWTQLTLDTTKKENQNGAWGQLFPNYRPASYSVAWAFPQDPYDPTVSPMTGRMRVFYRATEAHEKVAQKVGAALPGLYYSAADIGDIALLKTTIKDYVDENLVRFVTGDKDVDKDWDAYISQLKKLGLDRYLGIIQRNYDGQYGKKK
jgi:putative aldouronate transport system substrate-binding protein